ncbi:hypothetical protein AeRB84_009328, partial [Aphanomyces euteiches]
MFAELDRRVSLWIVDANEKNACLTGDMIMRKAQKIAKEMDLHDVVKCSKGWLYRLQIRHNLRMYRLHGEAGLVDQLAVEDGHAALSETTKLYDLSDIYNMDETGVMYNYQPSTTISNKPRAGQKKDKSRLTVALGANADGSDKLPLYFIGRSVRPRCFGNLTGKELGFLYTANCKAWMTMALFAEWISSLNERIATAIRSILLVLDNASSHKALGVELTNVRLLMLPPNTTAFLQPMDAGIIASFKRHFKRRQMDHAINVIEKNENVEARSSFAVNVLTAMEWSRDAWNDVTDATIRNCWGHTGIAP